MTDEAIVTVTIGDCAMRIMDGWLLCTACDEPVRANADGSYSCICRRWSQPAFQVELKRLGRGGQEWSLNMAEHSLQPEKLQTTEDQES